MATLTITFAGTATGPGTSAPVIAPLLGGDDLLILDMTAAPAGYHFTFGHTPDYSGILQQPDASGSYYWYFPPAARHGLSFGGIERFQVLGGAGDDTIVTGRGADTAMGGLGNDVIYTHRGAAVVDGGEGTDRWIADYSTASANITVNLGLDLLFGLAGSSLDGIEALGKGGFGLDRFLTGSGSDSVDTTGAILSDYIATGAGQDRVFLRGGLDTVDLGSGTDTLSLRWNLAGSGIVFGPGAGDYSYGQFTAGANHAAYFTGVDRYDILATAHDDNFATGNGDDTITGGLGDDTVSTRGGGAVVDLGAGFDTWGFDYRGLSASLTIDIDTNRFLGLGSSSVAGVEVLRSNTGDSNAYTGSGHDTVITGRQRGGDLLDTGAGNDSVTLFNGTDFVVMGTGATDWDVLTVDWRGAMPGSGESVTISMAATGDGDHTVSTIASGLGAHVNGVERLVYLGGAFYSTAHGGAADDALTGGGLGDNLWGEGGADVLTGLGGNDTMRGGEGSDWLTPGAGFDRVLGDAGVDMVAFSDALARVVVDLGAGTAVIGAESDLLFEIENVTGTVFADLITGSEGANRLRGLGDYDWFVGSGGGDTFDGGTGRDMVAYSAAGAGVTVSLSTGTGTAGQALGDRFAAIENLTGSGHADRLTGDADRNLLRGLGGDDFLFGLGGSDTLDGGTGRDALDGGLGNDRLTGGRGNDTVAGGSGWDTAIFSGNRSQYGVAVNADGSVRVSHGGGTREDGTDLLTGVEVLEFADGRIFL